MTTPPCSIFKLDDQRKLVLRMFVPGINKSNVSVRFAHDESTPIKWEIVVDRFSKALYLNPLDEEINKKFQFELTISIETSNGGIVPFIGKFTYGGKSIKCGIPTDVFRRIYCIRIDLLYPIAAISFCSCSIDSLKIMITKSRSRNELCDVQFLVEGNVIRAHKIILADRSEVFYKMFTSPLNDPAKANEPIAIEDVSYQGFNHFIDTIYTGITPTDPEICLEMIRMAEKYDVQDVKKAVEGRIIASINLNNAIAVLITSDINNAETVKKATLEFCARNPVHEMAESKSLANYPDLMNEVFKAKHNQPKA